MQIDLLEQFEATIEDKINTVLNFPVIRNFIINYGCVLYYTVIIELTLVDLSVSQISIQII